MSKHKPKQVRIAAVGDIHIGHNSKGVYRDALAKANQEADVLALCGDLTNYGSEKETEILLGELSGVNIPIVAVLGNHDYESGKQDVIVDMLCGRDIHVLDGGETFEINGWLGFAGSKGFCGGFGRGTLSAFGEGMVKDFVKEAMNEAFRLEMALRKLRTPVRVVLLHYAPVEDTVRGEPVEIYPYLGTSRLAEPLDNFNASVCFHGHAHRGAPAGKTLGGVPVFNVALPLLRRTNSDAMYHVYTAIEPEPEAQSSDTGAGERSPARL